jgi:phosphonate transport system substrate-binding protein
MSTPVCAQDNEAGVLVLGRVSDNPAAHYDRLRPMLDYVVARMGDLGIREGRVLMARDGAAMISYLRQGRVDWVTETAGASVAMIDRGGAELLALTWRGGLENYHSVFVTRKDSGIDALGELRGRKIGFQHPMSTSAYLVPAGMLLELGLPLAILLSPLDRAPEDFVGYAFTGAEANSVAWLHQRLIDVAVISNQDWLEEVVPVPAYLRDLQIIATSPDYPRALELVRGDLPAPIRRRLLEILVTAGDTEAGRAVMKSYFGTLRFSPVTTGIQSQVEALRPLVERVRQELQ